MNTQKDKEPKNKIMTIFWGMVILLAGGGLLVGNSFGIEVIGPVILFLFALCFISIAIRSKKTWWAIIPGGIFASLGVAAVMDILIPHSEVNGLAFMFLLALSFIVFAIRSKKNWWAIIPGGIFASIDLVVVLVFLVPHKDYPALPNTLHWGVYTWVLFLGFAATFGVLWLLRKTQPTDWAKYPAAGLLVIAVMALILGSRFQEIWTVSVLVAIGAMLILGLLTRVHLPSRQQSPHIKA